MNKTLAMYALASEENFHQVADSAKSKVKNVARYSERKMVLRVKKNTRDARALVIAFSNWSAVSART
jgi:hypothetical protein